MDTREKIVALGDLAGRLGDGEWTAAIGFFDPLTLANATRLADLAAAERRLLVIVRAETDTLLPTAARAELVAALRVVRLVAVANGDEWRAQLAGNPRVTIVLDEAT